VGGVTGAIPSSRPDHSHLATRENSCAAVLPLHGRDSTASLRLSEVKEARRAKRSRFERSVNADRRSPEGPRLESRATIPSNSHRLSATVFIVFSRSSSSKRSLRMRAEPFGCQEWPHCSQAWSLVSTL
jgi:hypothetical protein